MDDGPRHVNGNGDDLVWDRRGATQQANSPGMHRPTMIKMVLQVEMRCLRRHAKGLTRLSGMGPSN
jgi:hypothetical protein